MGRIICGLLIITGTVLFYSCGNTGDQSVLANKSVQNKILQQKDGSISLKVDKADCYEDMVNPSSNTAEWNVLVSRSGRFNIWLSSATRDTTDLNYKNTVKLNILDRMIEALPAPDKIIHNSTDVSYPYYRADSFIGSLYIQDTGLYNVQIISEKILPEKVRNPNASDTEASKLLSVILTPVAQ